MHVRGVWGRNTSRARVSTNLQPQRHGAKHIVHLLFCCPFSVPSPPKPPRTEWGQSCDRDTASPGWGSHLSGASSHSHTPSTV